MKKLAKTKLYKLRRWKKASSKDRLAFYSCARPGRSGGPKGQVTDDTVHKWLEGLPQGEKIVIVSLLGRKPDGMSEFSFYSFSGGFELPEERGRRPTFAEWVAGSKQKRTIKVLEHPTWDFKPIPSEKLDAIAKDIHRLLKEDWTVVLVDSGGETRAKEVCKYLQFVEDSRSP